MNCFLCVHCGYALVNPARAATNKSQAIVLVRCTSCGKGVSLTGRDTSLPERVALTETLARDEALLVSQRENGKRTDPEKEGVGCAMEAVRAAEEFFARDATSETMRAMREALLSAIASTPVAMDVQEIVEWVRAERRERRERVGGVEAAERPPTRYPNLSSMTPPQQVRYAILCQNMIPARLASFDRWANRWSDGTDRSGRTARRAATKAGIGAAAVEAAEAAAWAAAVVEAGGGAARDRALAHVEAAAAAAAAAANMVCQGLNLRSIAERAIREES